MHLFFSILGRELSPRRLWRVYLSRLATVGLGAALVVMVYLVIALMPQRFGAPPGYVMLAWIGSLALVMVGFLAPYVGAEALLRERQSRAWDMLRLTGFSVGGLVTARWLTASWRTGMVLAGLAPVALLGVSYGGVSGQQMGMLGLIALGTMVAGSGIGLLIGAWMLSAHRLTNVIIGLVMAEFLALPLGVALAQQFGLAPGWLTAELVSPHLLFLGILQDPDPEAVRLRLWVDLGVGVAALLLAILILPRRLYVADANKRRALQSQWLRGPKWLRPRITGNPMTWKDMQIHQRGVLGHILRAILRFVIIGGATAAGCRLLGLDWRWTLYLALGFMALLSVARFVTGYIQGVCQGMEHERQDNTLELLLMTDLKPSEILFGKQLAVYQSLLPDMLTLLAVIALAIWRAGDEQALFGALGVVAIVIAMAVLWYPVSGTVLLTAVLANRYTVVAAVFAVFALVAVGIPLAALLTVILAFVFWPLAIALPPLVFLVTGVGFRWIAVIALSRRRVNAQD